MIAANHWNPITPFKEVETDDSATPTSIVGSLRLSEALLCWITKRSTEVFIIKLTFKCSCCLN